MGCDHGQPHNAAGRALDPVKRTLHALPAQIAARDADLITERIRQISSVLDRLTEHIKTGSKQRPSR